jgi:divalent metal cation (Fe/Co/Zn/Cd) transporter
MVSLCQYKDLFGKPGEGAHSIRFMNIAVVDVFLTIVVGLAIAYFTGWPIGWTLLGFFILGILAHHIFCVKTTVEKWLFPE